MKAGPSPSNDIVKPIHSKAMAVILTTEDKKDGLQGEEGAFTTCTFWYAECLARPGRLDEARLTLEKGLSYANRLGLFAEELDRRGMQLGNFPQALTHLAFISAAHFLDRRLKDGGEI
jgi:GH15 family glucan-1,4-alpha-glucosidase